MRDLLEELYEGQQADPVRAAQVNMRPKLPKRFYKEATSGPGPAGHQVLLDGKPVRTPAKRLLQVPSVALAAMIAGEFGSQAEEINPMTMPVLRICNAAIDGVADNADAVLADIVAYVGSDLLCYRAHEPQRLADRQRETWDPVLDHVRQAHKAQFSLAEGVMPVEQSVEAIEAVRMALARQLTDPIRLAAAHVVTSASGSALLTLAFLDGALDSKALWAAATLDEVWSAEMWGHDAEAQAMLSAKWRDVDAACTILDVMKGC